MRAKVFAAVAACAAVAAPLALANGGGAQAVRVTESEWGITGVPAKMKAGTPFHVTVTNRGTVLHELVLEKGGCLTQCAVQVHGKNVELENIKPGSSKSATWTISKPGTYTLTCRKPGHWKAGMHRTFTVT